MADCLFCKIVRHEIPARIVHEDEDAVAFDDIDPQAPVHVLVVPRRHVPSLNDLAPADAGWAGLPGSTVGNTLVPALVFRGRHHLASSAAAGQDAPGGSSTGT